jgi:hypothetical protein
MEQTLQRFFSQVLDAGRVLLTLPRSLEQAITRLESGQIEVRLADNRPHGKMRLRGRRSWRANGEASGAGGLSWSFMLAASLAGGIFLMTDAHQFIAGWFCLGLAGLAALGMFVKR